MAANLTTQGSLHIPAGTVKPVSRLRIFLFGNRFHPGFIQNLSLWLVDHIDILFLLPFYWMINTALKSENRSSPSRPPGSRSPHVIQFCRCSHQQLCRQSGNRLPGSADGALCLQYLADHHQWCHCYPFLQCAGGLCLCPDALPGQEFLFLGILSTLMVPFAVVMVPQFIIWSKIRLAGYFFAADDSPLVRFGI